MLEKDIENYLRKEVIKAGGISYKFVSPGVVGVPDRIVLFPGGVLIFVEVKAPGKVLRASQLVQKKVINGMGRAVHIIDSFDQVDSLVSPFRGRNAV